HDAISSVRRGGTVSISGVYAGAADQMPMLQMFDKGMQLRMGQAHVRRWTPEIMPHPADGDELGTVYISTYHPPHDTPQRASEMFQKKQDGAIKVVLQP